MVTQTYEIPIKEATKIAIPKIKPEIIGCPGYESINFEGLVVPQSLNRTLFDRCGVEVKQGGSILTTDEVKEEILTTNKNKNLYMRFANDRPIALVTDKFREINPTTMAGNISGKLKSQPLVRYFQDNESVQMNFPIESRFPGLYIAVNTGPYGVFGGSGQNAIQYGITWFNKTCSNWTMFLGRDLMSRRGRIIHRNNGSENKNLDALIKTADELAMEIEDSKSKIFDRCDLENYFNAYIKKGMPEKIKETIVNENPNWISAYDLSYRLTQLCQDPKLSDVTRARIEYLAGEVILCYDRIMQNVQANTANMPMNARLRVPRVSRLQTAGQLYYVTK